MGRSNFSESVKNVIKKRAGYRCSFPGCNKLQVGPGANSDDFIELGECAHIYGASHDGPRFSLVSHSLSVKPYKEESLSLRPKSIVLSESRYLKGSTQLSICHRQGASAPS